jgi:ubiquinone/menaquinone biosynthesis C-methylase UbiE
MSASVLIHLLRDRLYWRKQSRVPEPDLVMQSEAQTTSFARAGEEDGVLAFLYLYNAVQISSVLQPGDRVLDLACGPANQLLQVARLNPQVHFVGLDASPTMLQRAQHTLAQAHIHNVELLQGDMTRLVHQEDASMDGVICTMSLHHLPDTAALATTLREIRRVLKPQGRVYLVDFGRLKLRSTQHFLAKDLRQSPQFTEDYFNSLRAAFSVEELTSAVAVLGPDVQRHVTALVPFFVVFRTAFQRPLDAPTLQRARDAFANLSATQQSNFRGVVNWLRLSGYSLACEMG